MLDPAGQQFGNYRLLHPLGHGGFADVYLVEHVYLRTRAALKLMQAHLDQNTLQKFLAEARIIANLTHPHIVRVLEFGIENVNQTPFLIMDYASRGTLRQHHGPTTRVPLPQVVNYVEQVASALQYAHRKDIIHRDVKPENMLVSEQNDVLLADFGIAVIARTTRYRSPQEISGTAAYMAPEQLQGRATTASDQYALGVVVYEWLSGTRPFEGSFPEVLAQHLTVAPPRLGERVSGLPRDVEEVIQKALAKEPQGRFSNIEEFAQAFKKASLSAQSSSSFSFGQNESTFLKNPLLPGHTQSQSTLLRPPLPHAFPSTSGSFAGIMPTIPASGSQPHAFSGIIPTMPAMTPPGIKFAPTVGNMATTREKPPIGNRARRNAGIVVGCVLLLVLLIGTLVLGTKIAAQNGNTTGSSASTATNSGTNSSATNAGASSRATPTPATIPVGTVLYNANHFIDHWIGSPEWKSVDGILGCDGNSSTSFTTWVPKRMPVANYQIRAQIQLVRSTYNEDPSLWGYNYEFGIMVRGDGNGSGYEIGMISLKDFLAQHYQGQGAQGAVVELIQNENTSSDSFIDGFSYGNAQLKTRDYQLDTSWHTYQVDVTGNDMKLYLDDTLLLETTDNTYLAPGSIGLRSVDADVNVKSFVVTAL